MIFGWDCVSCDDSAIATIRSPLQTSIHRQTVNLWPLSIRRGMLLGALILSAGGQFVAFICRGRGAFGSPYEDNDFGSLISSSMVVERKSRSRGDDSSSYVVPNDATVDILLAI